MIYKAGYFKKEMRRVYGWNIAGANRIPAFAGFSALFSFAVFFVLQTMKKSVLSDAVPQIMQASYFSTVFIYIHLAYGLNAIYYMIDYDKLFFSEIRKNSWYMLVKMGYRPYAMIAQKFAALLSSVLISYTAGFCLIVFLTFFLKYAFIFAYLPSLYFAGLVDLLLLNVSSMTLSLFIGAAINARYLIAALAVGIPVLKTALGFYGVLSDRVAMREFRNLFDARTSVYVPAAGAVILLCCLVGVFRANNLAKYYALSGAEWTRLYPETTIGKMDALTGRPVAFRTKSGRKMKIVGAFFTAAFVLMICMALMFNVLIILLSTSTPGNEVTIRGTIPYIFQSETMKPDIMYNDLAFFKRIDAQYPVSAGQIVLFQDDNVVYVERIAEISKAGIAVDIDNYPPMSETGSMQKTIQRKAIYGVYSGRSRWLGAFILFSNTLVGRLLFLLVPAVLLFYRKQILKFIRKREMRA